MSDDELRTIIRNNDVSLVLRTSAVFMLGAIDMVALVSNWPGVVCLTSFALGVMFTERYLKP